MSFHIDDKLLQKHETIWTNIEDFQILNWMLYQSVLNRNTIISVILFLFTEKCLLASIFRSRICKIVDKHDDHLFWFWWVLFCFVFFFLFLISTNGSHNKCYILIEGEGSEVAKSNNSKECISCHYSYSYYGFKFQKSVCISYHVLLMLCFNISNITIITVKLCCRCIIHDVSKSDAIHLLEIHVLDDCRYI